jgi:hypothetical protein
MIAKSALTLTLDVTQMIAEAVVCVTPGGWLQFCNNY